jgi:demethylmenaquinone methyltransferase/2-methoxy-6-polyprenyl-1,4-benzoquinol methylase
MDQHALVKRIFATTGKSYDFVVKMTTFWQDNSWKKRILEITDRITPYTVLDLACGTGILTCALAKKFPDSRIVGIDLQEEYLEYARIKKSENNLKNVEFHERSAEDVNEGEYDLITTSYLPKYVDLDLIVGNCSKMMNTGGLLIFHDFIYPDRILWRFFYNVYWVILRLVLWSSGSWREMGRELKGIIAETHWIDNVEKALRMHGFTDIHVEVQKFEIAAIVYATKLG